MVLDFLAVFRRVLRTSSPSGITKKKSRFSAPLTVLPNYVIRGQEFDLRRADAVKDERSEVNHISGNACALSAEDSKGKAQQSEATAQSRHTNN